MSWIIESVIPINTGINCERPRDAMELVQQIELVIEPLQKASGYKVKAISIDIQAGTAVVAVEEKT